MLDESIKEIHIEPTSLCNASCIQCARNINGEDLNPNVKLGSLDLDWFQNNLKKTTLNNINKIFFCGNVGDPAASPYLLNIIKYLKTIKPNLIIGLNTNGGLKTQAWWKKLAKLLTGKYDYCVFSIDGLEDTNHIYRKNVEWNKLVSNVSAFIKEGGNAHWDMLVFKHNKDQLQQAKMTARTLGFKWFRSKETDRWDTYPKTGIIEPANKYVEIDYTTSVPVCEKNRDNSIFLDYTGKWWPCCHMAEAYLNVIGYVKHKDLRKFTNTELFDQYQKRLNHNPFYICQRACGKGTGKRSQWKTEIEFSKKSQ